MPCSLQFQTNSQPVRTWLHGKLPCMQQHILDSYFMFCWWKLIEISRVLNAFNVNMIEKIRHRSDSETLGPRALIVLQVPLMHVDDISIRSVRSGSHLEYCLNQVWCRTSDQSCFRHSVKIIYTYQFWIIHLIFGGWLVHVNLIYLIQLSQMALRSHCFPTRNRWIDYLKDLGGITSFSDAPWRICHGNNNLADVPKQRLDSTPQLWRVKSCVFFSGELAKHGQICREPKWSQGEDVGVGRVPCCSCSLSTFTLPCITV